MFVLIFRLIIFQFGSKEGYLTKLGGKIKVRIAPNYCIKLQTFFCFSQISVTVLWGFSWQLKVQDLSWKAPLFNNYWMRLSIIWRIMELEDWAFLASADNTVRDLQKRPFYSCGLSILAFEWKWGWGWPCFYTNLLPFVMDIMLEKY